MSSVQNFMFAPFPCFFFEPAVPEGIFPRAWCNNLQDVCLSRHLVDFPTSKEGTSQPAEKDIGK